MTARDSTDGTEDFAHLVFRVYGAFHSSLFRAVAPEPGLGRAGLEIMGYLHASGASTITETAQACRMATSQLSLSVERLVEKGLIERDRNGRDRRIALISLTKSGEKAFARAYEGVRERVEAFFTPLSEGELQTVREAFRIIAGLGADQGHKETEISPKPGVRRAR